MRSLCLYLLDALNISNRSTIGILIIDFEAWFEQETSILSDVLSLVLIPISSFDINSFIIYLSVQMTATD